jgi:hypothetical protein
MFTEVIENFITTSQDLPKRIDIWKMVDYRADKIQGSISLGESEGDTISEHIM